MNVNNELKEYVEKNIYPLYENNFLGDGIDRVGYVIDRSNKIILENNLDVDWNILYTAISFHDIRKNNEEKNHELVSAEIMYNDYFIKNFFSDGERIIIKEAIEDQRSNLNSDPRNIYGKILSSASRNSSVEQCLRRSFDYGKKRNPELSNEDIMENSYNVLLNKFGENGYAKFYFKDSTYEKFLKDIRALLSDKNKFKEEQRKINNII